MWIKEWVINQITASKITFIYVCYIKIVLWESRCGIISFESYTAWLSVKYVGMKTNTNVLHNWSEGGVEKKHGDIAPQEQQEAQK